MNLRRGRRVLDQLQHFVPEDDGACGIRQVASDGERPGVDLLRQQRAAGEVLDQVGEPADHARPLGVDGLLQRRRIGDDEIGRRQRVDQQRDHEAGAIGAGRVEMRVVDTGVERPAERDVGLQQAAEARAVAPRLVGKAAVPAGRRQCRTARRDLEQFAEELCVLPRDGARLAREAGQQRRRRREHLLAPDAHERVGRQRVARSGQRKLSRRGGCRLLSRRGGARRPPPVSGCGGARRTPPSWGCDGAARSSVSSWCGGSLRSWSPWSRSSCMPIRRTPPSASPATRR